MTLADRTPVLLILLVASCAGDKGVSVYNTAPGVAIVQPSDGASFAEGDAITFQATVDDDQQSPETLALTWSSDVDGIFDTTPPDSGGAAVVVTGALTPTDHVIQVKVIDDKELSATDFVSIHIADLEDAPAIDLRSPIGSDYGIEDEPFEFEAVVSDEQDDPEELYVWFESDLDSIFCEPAPTGGGVALCEETLSVGTHTLTFGVEDTTGNQATVDVDFEVRALSAMDDDGDGYTEDEGDCDDTDSSVHPGATEYANGIDDDCDGEIDEGTADFDDDGDGYTEAQEDCDDGDPTAWPGAPEECDGVDDDCDGEIDEGTECYDDDGDGYTEDEGDCDDADHTSYPGAEEVPDGADNNCDGTIDEETDLYDDDGDCTCESGTCTGSSEASCTSLSDGDCDDDNADINPSATEVCDGHDNDCDGATDEGLTSTYYADADRDGYGDATTTAAACSEPSGYTSDKTDCDDTNSSVNPGETEVCNGVDDNCDGHTDGSYASDASTYYRDGDGDGYGSTTTTKDCSTPSGYTSITGDCDDTAGSVNPGASESCNGVDDDCDGSVDEGVSTSWYRDADGDGYGDASSPYSGCAPPSGYVGNATDCDDTDASINPYTVWYLDYDGDGYGGSSVTKTQCVQPSGYVATATDCDDLSSASHPGATETCDGSDNDCDGSTDEINASGCTDYYYDFDGDGYGSGTAASRCYCSATGYYKVTNKSDCYDLNSSASPAATTYHTSNRGDGSYDYNCDSTESKQYTANYDCTTDWTGFSCDSYTNGWSTSSDPSCGSSGTWYTGCTASWFACSYNSSSSKTQSCR